MSNKKIFISHKRQNGTASSEAILIHEMLQQKRYYQPFMDVREAYIGEFSTMLISKIKESDVFILIYPPKDVLLDKKGWVYHEIKEALSSHEQNSKPSKILPIAFSHNIEIPSKEELGDIKKILDYNIFYFDKNDPNIKDRLYKAIGRPKLSISTTILSLSIVVLALFLAFFIFKPDQAKYTKEVMEYNTEISKLNSLQSYADNHSLPTKKFLEWYLEELTKNKDLSLNREFNQAYVKQGLIRLTVLSYLAFTCGDLASEQNPEYVTNLINECYNAIPKDKNSPIAFNGGNQETRDALVKEIIETTIMTLEKRPDIKKAPSEFHKQLTKQIISKFWVN